MLRKRFITSAQYHAHRWRSVSCFTDSKQKIYLVFTSQRGLNPPDDPSEAASLTLVLRGPANLDHPTGSR